VNPTILSSSITTEAFPPNLPDWTVATCVLRSILRIDRQRWFAKANQNFPKVDVQLPVTEFAFANTLSESTSATEGKPVHTHPKSRSNPEAIQTSKLADHVLNPVCDSIVHARVEYLESESKDPYEVRPAVWICLFHADQRSCPVATEEQEIGRIATEYYPSQKTHTPSHLAG